MSDTGHASERRTHPRLDAAADVEIVIDSAPGVKELDGKSVMCRTADVSLRGVRLLTDVTLPVGAYLKLRIKLPRQQERYRQAGRVVWCRPNRDPAAGVSHHAGIEFSLGGNPDFDAWRGALLRLFEEGAGG
jgi:hypothetical protein